MTAINSTPPKEKSNHLFPVFLKPTNLRFLIVGGGYAAMEKLLSVLSNSPETAIKLVATVVCDDIKQLGYELVVTKGNKVPIRSSNRNPKRTNCVICSHCIYLFTFSCSSPLRR